jgi:GntR family transcriptional regulator
MNTKSARMTPLVQEDRPSEIDSSSPTPLYHQIFTILRDKIYRGEYERDSFLPGEQEIAAFFGVSRITAKRALDEIAAAGLAVREQGRGTRVCITPRGNAVRGNVDGLLHSLHAKGAAAVQLLDFAYVAAPDEVTERLALSAGDEVQRATRIWRSDAGPFNYLTTFVPATIGRRWNREELERKTLISLLEESGTRIDRAEERITATLADETTAAILEVRSGSALLKVIRTLYDQRQRPVEYLVALYPPERYHYTVTLGRDQTIEHGVQALENMRAG